MRAPHVLQTLHAQPRFAILPTCGIWQDRHRVPSALGNGHDGRHQHGLGPQFDVESSYEIETDSVGQHAHQQRKTSRQIQKDCRYLHIAPGNAVNPDNFLARVLAHEVTHQIQQLATVCSHARAAVVHVIDIQCRCDVQHVALETERAKKHERRSDDEVCLHLPRRLNLLCQPWGLEHIVHAVLDTGVDLRLVADFCQDHEPGHLGQEFRIHGFERCLEVGGLRDTVKPRATEQLMAQVANVFVIARGIAQLVDLVQADEGPHP
mmetsp:Transcript_64427/g.197077  ORF Transcript_64427/g.197077 Transcript_64427/m.197077 type:complete len:264 (-) Transcript_64427:55-846(-)